MALNAAGAMENLSQLCAQGQAQLRGGPELGGPNLPPRLGLARKWRMRCLSSCTVLTSIHSYTEGKVGLGEESKLWKRQ